MVDNQQFSAKEYPSRLETLNIFYQFENFLGYQEKVEKIALKNPKERMHMFEEISESIQFKDDYIKGLVLISLSLITSLYSTAHL